MKKIYRSKILASAVFLLLTTISALAQKQVVSGRVVDPTGTSLPGVNVVVKGTTIGTTTDSNGRFSLEAGAQDVLVFSFIGFGKQEIDVANQTDFNITLSEDVSTLEEIVVVGYGEMKRSSLSSAQVSISSDQINQTVNTTIEQAIQGRAANVYITQNTGQPGGGISVNIRGINSISNSNEPLYVIDGVQILGGAGGSYGMASTTNPLASLNAADIESLEILQGPAATAIYGSRAANGVIVITTKRGKAGEMKVGYIFNYTLQDEPEFLETMNLKEYAAFVNESRALRNWTPIAEFQELDLLGEGTNWQEALFRPAPLVKHQLNVSGGNEKTSYYLSGEYFDQDGVAVGSNFNRYGLRMNIDNQTREWMKIGTSLLVNQTQERLTASNDDLIGKAIGQPANIAVTNPDGSWGGPTNSDLQFALDNPLALANINDHTFKRTNIIGNLSLDLTPIKGLLIRNSISTNLQFAREYQFNPSYKFGNVLNPRISAMKATSNSVYWNLNTLIQYNKSFGNHNVTVMASHESQESTWERHWGSAEGFITNTIPELSLGDPDLAKNGSNKNAWAMESYFGRLSYDFNDKYIVQATFRADGSSNFGANNRWGYFPSVSAAWRISNEAFLQGVSQISNLKLRLERGTTGNQNSGGITYFGALRSNPTWEGPGFLTGNYANPDFQWEQTVSSNIGLDFGLFNNRIEFIGDLYVKETDNLMMQIPLPGYMGTEGEGNISAPWVNIGALENRGYGITINTVNIERPFTWKTSLNFSSFKNELTALYSNSALLDRTLWFMPNFISRSIVGQSVWRFYGYEKDGMFLHEDELVGAALPAGNTAAPNSTWVGDFRYKDQLTVDTDGDGIKDAGDGVINQDDRTFIGNPYPKFTFGITNSFSYKNFDLSVLVTGTYGNDIFNHLRFSYSNPFGTGNERGFLAEAATYARLGVGDDGKAIVTNPTTRIPRLSNSDTNGNGGRATQDYIEDGSHIRIKSVQLSYNLPDNILSKQSIIKRTRLSVGVQNLFTFTKYKGYDPEVGAYIGNYADTSRPAIGVDNGRYPLTRMYSFSIDVEF
jgi:TonB-dependent starch-binding outer membrane protein SusC